MCGRYVVFSDKDIQEMERIIHDLQNRLENEPVKTGEVYPTNTAAVLINQNEPAAMKWGFPKWDGKGVIINARSETASERKMFSKPLENTRCIIPTTGFFEWDKNKIKYLFTYEEPVLYLAGIYNTFGKGENQYNAFSIFTRAANPSMQDIHERMPVILYKNEIEDYLNEPKFIPFVFNRDTIYLKREALTEQLKLDI